jgi:hypothetical protein
MIEKLGEGFDADVLQWKSDIEHAHKKLMITEAAYNVFESNCINDDHDIAEKVEKKVGKGIYSNEIMSGVIDDANRRNGCGENSKEIYSSLIQMYKLQRAPGFQITGDNVDLAIKARHMSTYKQNQSIHWFNLNAVKNRVNGNHLSDKAPAESILTFENVCFLPSLRDNQDLMHDLIPLFARSIVYNIPALSKVFSRAIVHHIPHMYTDVMNEKSEQVCQSMLFPTLVGGKLGGVLTDR